MLAKGFKSSSGKRYGIAAAGERHCDYAPYATACTRHDSDPARHLSYLANTGRAPIGVRIHIVEVVFHDARTTIIEARAMRSNWTNSHSGP